MAYINETKFIQEYDIQIEVLEREDHEDPDPWKIISIDFNSMQRFTPKELRSLGKCLISEGKRIGREYKSNGKIKNK